MLETGKEVMVATRPPDKVLEEAKIAVNVFKSIIERKPKQVIINDEQYLEYEDWQTLGEFYRVSAVTRDAVPVEVNGVKGAKARADLVNIDTGVVVGGAEAYCMRDEERWSTRPKYEWQGQGKDRKKVKLNDEPVPWFQLASMAQTRAGSKAFSNRLRWVAVMAGYRGTPAEEMSGHEEDNGHYCALHKTAFFKKGAMKSYAHKISGTDKWCNEDDVIDSTAQVVDKPQEGPAEKAVQDKVPAEQGKGKPKRTEEQIQAIRNINDLFKACHDDWPEKYAEGKAVVKDLGYSSKSDIADPANAYRTIASLNQEPPA